MAARGTICNKCKKDCNVAVSTGPDPIMNFCGERYSYTGCYGSYALGDLVRYEWCLCEGCLAEMFRTFEIPPTEGEVLA